MQLLHILWNLHNNFNYYMDFIDLVIDIHFGVRPSLSKALSYFFPFIFISCATLFLIFHLSLNHLYFSSIQAPSLTTISQTRWYAYIENLSFMVTALFNISFNAQNFFRPIDILLCSYFSYLSLKEIYYFLYILKFRAIEFYWFLFAIR